MRAVLLCLFVVLAAPVPASAATLVKSGSTLTYTAANGRTNQPNFNTSGSAIEVTRGADDNDAIQPTGCSGNNGTYTCPGISLVVVITMDGDDVVTASGIGAAVQANG